MNIKIIASSKEGFEKIENSLKLLNEDFIKKFNVVIAEESAASNIIQLTTNYYYDDRIYLSVDKIMNVCLGTNKLYEKIGEEIKEVNKYNVSIYCEKSGQKFEFNLNNRNKPDIKILNCE